MKIITPGCAVANIYTTDTSIYILDVEFGVPLGARAGDMTLGGSTLPLVRMQIGFEV